MIRVLMISKACIVGIYQRKLEYIAQNDIDLLTVVPPSWRDERGETTLERAYTEGYTLDVLPMRFNGNFHLHFYAGLGKRIRQFKPDIVHIDEEPYNVAAWQALYHARKVGAKSLFFSWQNIKRDYPPPFAWGERWVLKHVDYAIMGTDSAGEVWRTKGYTGRMRTIPQFGTDPDLFRPAEARAERPFTMGYVGRLVAEKGIDTLIAAVSQLAGDWRLRIVGGGPARLPLAAQVEQLGIAERVTFDGQIPSTQTPSMYHQLDALVLPSETRHNWKEQFGRTLVEAMASGVPVIGSDSGAIPDVIGDAGLIFREGDIEGLTAALTRLRDVTALGQRLCEAGSARVLEHFTHVQISAETVEVYRELMGYI
jgi:glycosyltransferase involved in cell wall biosynthesis